MKRGRSEVSDAMWSEAISLLAPLCYNVLSVLLERVSRLVNE